MSDDQDGYEWVVFLLVPAYPDSPGPKAVKRLCVWGGVQQTTAGACEVNSGTEN